MEKQYEEIILVSTDLSENSEHAVQYAAEMAVHLKYALYIVYTGELEQQEADQKLEKSAESIRGDKPQSIKHLYRKGEPHDKIPEVAKEIKASLIIIGTHPEKGLKHSYGKDAIKLITNAPCPTIVVKDEKFGDGLKNIVLPVSDYMESRQMVNWAVHIAKVFNSTIHIYEQNEKYDDLKQRLDIISRQIMDAFDKTDVRYEKHVSEKSSHFIDQVIDFTKSTNADLVMVMTKPGTFDQDYNLHKWDKKLIDSSADVPVMCINPLELGQVHYFYLRKF